MANAGIVSENGTLTESTIGEVVYSGNAYKTLADAVTAGESTIVLDGFTCNTRQEFDSGVTLIGNNNAAIADCTLTGNTGGALKITATSTISGLTFSNNSITPSTDTAYCGGGAIYTTASQLTVNNCLFDSNTSNRAGGAIAKNDGKNISVSNTVFSGNSAKFGGAFATRNGTNDFVGGKFINNTASSSGGAIYMLTGAGVLNLSGVLFKDNSAGTSGGAVYRFTHGSVNIQKDSNGNRTIFDHNYSGGSGGAIYLNSQLDRTSTFNDVIFTGNTAKNNGGAIISTNNVAHVTNLHISGTTFSGNVAETGNGGAIYNVAQAVLVITDSEFLTSSDTIYNLGNLTFSGKNTLAASVTGTGSITVTGATFNFINSAAIDMGALTGTAAEMNFSGSAVNFTGQDLSGVAITVDGTLFAGETVTLATGVTAADVQDITITTAGVPVWYKDLAVTLDNGALVLGGTVLDYTAAGIVSTDGKLTHATVDGKLFAGKNYSSLADALAAENSVLLYDMTVNGGDQLVLAAGQTLYGGNDAVISGHNTASALLTGGATVSDLTFSDNKLAKIPGGAVTLETNTANTFSNCTFTGNSASAGGAVYAAFSSAVANNFNDSVFMDNHAAGMGGAVYGTYCNYQFTSTDFSKNSSGNNGGAVYIQTTGKTSNFAGCTFTGNTSDANGGALAAQYNILVNIARDAAQNRTVFDGNTASFGGAIMFATQNTLTVTDAIFCKNNAANNGGAIINLNTKTGKEFNISGCTFAENSANGGGAVSFRVGEITISDTLFTGNIARTRGGGAIWNGDDMPNLTNKAHLTISGCTFATASDTINNISGSTMSITKSNRFAANITGLGEYLVTDADLTFTNDEAITVAALNFNDTLSTIDFAGTGEVNFTDQSLSDVALTVNGSLYQGEAVTIATGVTAIGKYTITGNPFLMLAVENNNLLLKEVAGETITGTSFTGEGVTVMDNGAVGTFFATKDNESEIATKISGGKVEQNLVGGAYVAAGNTAAVDKVELLIGGTAEVAAKVYAGGYLYGNGTDSAEAQLKVAEVNISIDGGAVSTNMYGGAHARQNGNAKVDTVNITVTDGSHGRIYAGGWAEKGAVSSVGTANVTISGGTVDYLYGGGANADGTTTVGATTITIENSALVNTVFMSGRYGYSSVSGTVTLNYNSTTGMKRLSGVSSAGVDNAKNTVVNVLSDLTADLIDYVDKFVISENCTLTANDAFYLGNRLENGETDGFTTFDFIAEGEAEWTAVAGIDDFTNAKFSVNGAGLTTWDGESVKTIGDYTLTYDEDKKTITLANA